MRRFCLRRMWAVHSMRRLRALAVYDGIAYDAPEISKVASALQCIARPWSRPSCVRPRASVASRGEPGPSLAEHPSPVLKHRPKQIRQSPAPHHLPFARFRRAEERRRDIARATEFIRHRQRIQQREIHALPQVRRGGMGGVADADQPAGVPVSQPHEPDIARTSDRRPIESGRRSTRSPGRVR